MIYLIIRFILLHAIKLIKIFVLTNNIVIFVHTNKYFINENLPGKEIELRQLADEVINRGIMPGYFSMTYAPQWRLNYEDAVSLKNNVGRIINRDYSR